MAAPAPAPATSNSSALVSCKRHEKLSGRRALRWRIDYLVENEEQRKSGVMIVMWVSISFENTV